MCLVVRRPGSRPWRETSFGRWASEWRISHFSSAYVLAGSPYLAFEPKSTWGEMRASQAGRLASCLFANSSLSLCSICSSVIFSISLIGVPR